jgi:hypothetical protein
MPRFPGIPGMAKSQQDLQGPQGKGAVASEIDIANLT